MTDKQRLKMKSAYSVLSNKPLLMCSPLGKALAHEGN
jgi:hypothetical protein